MPDTDRFSTLQPFRRLAARNKAVESRRNKWWLIRILDFLLKYDVPIRRIWQTPCWRRVSLFCGNWKRIFRRVQPLLVSRFWIVLLWNWASGLNRLIGINQPSSWLPFLSDSAGKKRWKKWKKWKKWPIYQPDAFHVENKRHETPQSIKKAKKSKGCCYPTRPRKQNGGDKTPQVNKSQTEGNKKNAKLNGSIRRVGTAYCFMVRAGMAANWSVWLLTPDINSVSEPKIIIILVTSNQDRLTIPPS